MRRNRHFLPLGLTTTGTRKVSALHYCWATIASPSPLPTPRSLVLPPTQSIWAWVFSVSNLVPNLLRTTSRFHLCVGNFNRQFYRLVSRLFSEYSTNPTYDYLRNTFLPYYKAHYMSSRRWLSILRYLIRLGIISDKVRHNVLRSLTAWLCSYDE